MFFGQVVSSDVIDFVDPGPKIELTRNFGLETRVRSIRVLNGALMSPHIIDLKPLSATDSKDRPRTEKPARLAILVYTIKQLFRHPSTKEFDALHPSRSVSHAGGTLSEFVKLPFLMLALPFKTLKKKNAAAKLKESVPVIVDQPEEPVPAGRTARQKRIFFAIPENWHRSLASFAVIAVVIALPALFLASYASVTDTASAAARQTTAALDDLKAAGKGSLRLQAAAAGQFNRAAEGFSASRTKLRGVTLSLGALLTGNSKKLKDGHRLLAAGESASLAGAEIASAFELLEEGPERSLTTRVSSFLGAFGRTMPHLETALSELEAVSPESLPKEYRDYYATILTDMRSVHGFASRLLASSDAFMNILGADGKRRYLVLFQNDRELRPTGGFIGSYALMDIQDGEIVNTEIPAGGSYDLRGGLSQRIAAPEQLRLVNARWEFQDANWFADFPTSATTLTWFYEKSGGPTVDGVIAVTSTFMESLLEIVGPVELKEYGKTISSENFFIETQKAVELEYDRNLNRPKQFISDMAPKVLEHLINLEKEDLMPLIDSVSRSLAEKHILLQFRNEEEQGLASAYGWSGELKPLDKADFLAVIDSNIAGGKTDGVISANIRHVTDVSPDGSLINTVTIRRTHHGVKGDLFTGIKNIDYMRVYVPQGSELISAEGFEAPGDGYFLEADETLEPSTLLAAVEGNARIDEESDTVITEESGLTVFGNWIQLEPGESKAIRLTYRLPYSLNDLVKTPMTAFEKLKDAVGAYSPTAGMRLVVQRQPGASNRHFSSTIRYPAGWSIRSRIPEQAIYRDGGLSFEGSLESDLYVGMVLTKTN